MDMIKFYRGLLENLPQAGTNGALYITTDEGAIYYGTGTGMKRLGDFIQVANVAALPEKAHESCLYYCVAENILAKWNGSEWKQINKQPTAEEMKTLLGLGSLAYLSEVSESNLSTALATKINGAVGVQHSHENKTALDGITAEKVSAWDSAEKNAKDYADGLNTTMNGRVEALEAIDHSHTFVESELNKIVDGDVAKWNTAAEKAHTHSFNETELNKIVEGDVAKWNGVAADHLTSADKTTLENSIKEAKKAGTDANTNIEAYKVTNDARVLAVEEDVAEIVDGTNGILAQAKSYSDGKLATARTEISAEIDADVKVVADELAGYKSSNDAALAGVKATAEAAATKEYTDAELAKKVDKVEGKSLISDSEITRLAGMSTGANKVEKSDTNGNIKIDGVETVVYTHPEKHTVSDISDFETKIASYDYATKTELGNVDKRFENYKTSADQKLIDDEQDRRLGLLETASATHATKDELNGVDAKFANYKTAADQKAIDDEQDRRLGELEGASATHATKDELAGVDAKFADYTKTSDLPTDLGDFTNNAGYAKTVDVNAELAKKADKSVVDAMYTNSQIDGFIATEKERAEGIEGGLRTDVNTILGDYLKASDKTELEGKITAEENRAKGVEESLQTQINTIMSNPDAEGAINSINEFTQYVKDHGTIADGFRTDIDKNKEDIAANTKAIEDEASRADAAEKVLAGRLDVLEAIDHEAYVAADAEVLEAAKTAASNQDVVVLAEAQAYTDAAKADAIADAAAKYETKGTAQGIVDGLNLSETYEPIGAEGRAIAAAKTETENQVKALADTLYTKSEVDALIEAAHTWGEF